jgi:hypothetical protein
MVRQKGSMLGAFSRAESEIFKLVEKQILSGKHSAWTVTTGKDFTLLL